MPEPIKKTRDRAGSKADEQGFLRPDFAEMVEEQDWRIILKTSVEREKDVQAFDVIKESGK